MSCNRCTALGIPCSVGNNLVSNDLIKFLCHQCLVDGQDDCLFPPSIRLTHGHLSNQSCVACRSSRRRCNFLNVDDNSCIRCRCNGIPCRIKLSGESLCTFFPAPLFPPSYLVNFHSARGATARCIEEKLAILFPGAYHQFFAPPSRSQLDTCLLPNIHIHLAPHTSRRHCPSFLGRFVCGLD